MHFFGEGGGVLYVVEGVELRRAALVSFEVLIVLHHLLHVVVLSLRHEPTSELVARVLHFLLGKPLSDVAVAVTLVPLPDYSVVLSP